ncbi:radical SAM protein [Aeromonas media]|uniref:radical SAM protein n=3 Tax=Aeromonas media TaxID=651 RepID=UPI003D1E8721
MNEIIFDVHSKVPVHRNVRIISIDAKHIALHAESANWLVLSSSELVFFNAIHAGNSILDALKYTYKELQITEEQCLEISKSVLSQISRYDFFTSNKGSEEESVLDIKKNIQINLTSDCNLKCKHCYISAGRKNYEEINKNDIVKFINSLERNRISDDIVISGGEPLLHDDFYEISNYLKSQKYNITLFTNGTKIDKNNIDEIKRLVSSIQISMEGISCKSFESIRGKNTYSKVISAIELIIDNDIPLIIAITLIDSNIKDVNENIIDFLSSLKGNNVTIRVNNELERSGNALTFPSSYFEFNVKRHEKTNEIIKKIHSLGFNYEQAGKRGILYKNCGIGSSIIINYDGRLYPCNEFSEKSKFTINDCGDIVSIFDELNVSTNVDNSYKCSNCELRNICCGGCKQKNKKCEGGYLNPVCDREKIYRKMAYE